LGVDGEVTMAQATAIVPREARVVELRGMRRLKTRRALQICIGAAASTLVAAFLLPSDLYAVLLIALAGMAFVSGMAAIVLRFVEKPREVVLRKVRYERDPARIHPRQRTTRIRTCGAWSRSLRMS
jgi:hypothetical protein